MVLQNVGSGSSTYGACSVSVICVIQSSKSIPSRFWTHSLFYMFKKPLFQFSYPFLQNIPHFILYFTIHPIKIILNSFYNHQHQHQHTYTHHKQPSPSPQTTITTAHHPNPSPIAEQTLQKKKKKKIPDQIQQANSISDQNHKSKLNPP